MNKQTQCQKVLAYMEEHGSITQREAIWLGIYRLSGRIFDLRKEHSIKTDMIPVTNKDGSISTVASYSLERDADG